MRSKIERDERERKDPFPTLCPEDISRIVLLVLRSFLRSGSSLQKKSGKSVQEDSYPELKHRCITSFISASEIRSRILISSFLGSLKIQLNLMQKKWKRERSE